MRSTKEVYGNQSFKKLRELGCIKVYKQHIKMLKKHKKWLVNNPESFDEVSGMGYIDYNLIKKADMDIELFEGLIKQAKAH